MKRKFLSLMLAAALAGTLAGCSSELSNEYVTVKQYKGLEVPQPETATEEITDEDVQQVIDGNLSMYAERETVTDRAAQEGDIANIDYTGYLDGEAFDGGSAEGAELELGSGSFIGATEDYEGFEEQIEGHNVGDEFDIEVQFPDPYDRNPDMSGAVATFHIVLNGLETETVPELTDEWVRENSEDSETADEYREEIRAELEDNVEQSVQSELQNSVLQALLENVEASSYPEETVNEMKTQMTDYYSQMAAMYGVELDEFLTTYMQTTQEEFDAQIEEYAQQSAALDEALKLIAEKEKLEPTEEEYQERYAEYAEESGYEDVDTFVEDVGEEDLKASVLQQVVAEYLVDHCIQVEQSGDSE